MIDELLGDQRLIAMLIVDDAGAAPDAARALAAGGVKMVEVLLRNSTGIAAISAIASQVPEVIVGAGTVLDTGTLERAIDAGAAFAVSPGFDSELATAAAKQSFAYLPGAVTATEVQACIRAGITTVKFFPASTSGGPAALRALSSAFAIAGIGFVPTGGVDGDNVYDYLDVETVRAVGMSWLAPSSAIASGDFETLSQRARLITEQLAKGAM